MTTRQIRAFALSMSVLALTALTACGGSGSSPSGPSGVSGVPSTMRVELTQGTTVVSPNADGTYTIAIDVRYHLYVYFNHPGASGHRIDFLIAATKDGVPVELFGDRSQFSGQFGIGQGPEDRVGREVEVGHWLGEGLYQIQVKSTETGSDISTSVLENTVRLIAR